MPGLHLHYSTVLPSPLLCMESSCLLSLWPGRHSMPPLKFQPFHYPISDLTATRSISVHVLPMKRSPCERITAFSPNITSCSSMSRSSKSSSPDNASVCNLSSACRLSALSSILKAYYLILCQYSVPKNQLLTETRNYHSLKVLLPLPVSVDVSFVATSLFSCTASSHNCSECISAPF